ncbi:MAG: HPr(Ser) kinase/phosphatase [Deltaproteobacteria bacterium]|nr:HPr(Ser) kinase/phosphatase [Deltaproteobacteria bacterium]
MKGVKVGELSSQKSLKLELVGGAKGLDKEILAPRVQKTGLLLTGKIKDKLIPGRVQVIGEAELAYLSELKPAELRRALLIFSDADVPAMVVTKGLKPNAEIKKLADKEAIPLYVTPFTSSVFIENLIKVLEEKLSPSTIMHGVFVDVLGIGVIIKGKSGIGKSECALDLISRGYRLVADDVIMIKRAYPAMLYGTASGAIRHHIEVRGIGIVNIKDLFGITAIRDKKPVDIVVELVEWNASEEYERLGFEDKTVDILGVEVPYLKIPVSPGRSVATIVEVAARNKILKLMGMQSGLEALMSLPPAEPAQVKKAPGKRAKRGVK